MKVFLIIFIIFTCLMTFIGCSKKQNTELKLGVGDFVGELPTFVAYEMNYFEEEGLDVTLVYYEAGKDALNAILEGEVDIGTSAQTPVMYKAFERDDFSFLGSMMNSGKITMLVGRADHGIFEPKDLEGKTLGLYHGTAAEYIWRKFSDYHQIDRMKVKYVDKQPQELADVIINGEVDAIIIWEPFVYKVKKKLKDNATFIEVGNINTAIWLMSAKNELIEQNPEAIESYLRAINRAEEFINSDSQEAMSIFSKYSSASEEYKNYIFENVSFELTMSEVVMEILENQAIWAIEEGRVESETIPNFTDFFYNDAIDQVSPESNNVIK